MTKTSTFSAIASVLLLSSLVAGCVAEVPTSSEPAKEGAVVTEHPDKLIPKEPFPYSPPQGPSVPQQPVFGTGGSGPAPTSTGTPPAPPVCIQFCCIYGSGNAVSHEDMAGCGATSADAEAEALRSVPPGLCNLEVAFEPCMDVD